MFRGSKNKKHMHTRAWRQSRQQLVLMGAPGFHHQPPYAVAVHGVGEFLFGNGKANLQVGTRWAWVGGFRSKRAVNELYGKNRKRFPGVEKRLNMLLAFEPLIYFESMTNGRKIYA